MRECPAKKVVIPRIICISSEMGSLEHALDPNFPYYGVDNVSYKVSKDAMNMVGTANAVKYGRECFKVNLCCPGPASTSYCLALGDLPLEGRSKGNIHQQGCA